MKMNIDDKTTLERAIEVLKKHQAGHIARMIAALLRK